MVNNNKLIIENKKPTETVYEIKNEIPSYEEFMKDYEVKTSKLSPAARSKIVKRHGSDYLSERAFNNDIALMQMYGPGFWDDIKGVVKPIATGALVVASVFPPTAAVAAPIAYTVIGAGVAATGIGHVADSEGWKEVGKDLLEIGSGARDGQGVTESYDAPLNQYARSRR